MEKKITSKKKLKTQIKREDSATKVANDVSETGETLEDSSQVKSKKSRKRKISFEEDIIDGFLMLSYATLEDLEVGVCVCFRFNIGSFLPHDLFVSWLTSYYVMGIGS